MYERSADEVIKECHEAHEAERVGLARSFAWASGGCRQGERLVLVHWAMQRPHERLSDARHAHHAEAHALQLVEHQSWAVRCCPLVTACIQLGQQIESYACKTCKRTVMTRKVLKGFVELSLNLLIRLYNNTESISVKLYNIF